MLRRIIGAALRAVADELTPTRGHTAIDVREHRRVIEAAPVLPVVQTPAPRVEVAEAAEAPASPPEIYVIPMSADFDEPEDAFDEDSIGGFDDEDSYFDASTPVEETRHDILKALGLTPIARPVYKAEVKTGERDADGNPITKSTEEDALDVHGRPVHFDDVAFSAYLMTHRKEFSHIPDARIDALTQLPVVSDSPSSTSSAGVVYAPAVSKRGDTRSWGGSTVTPLDLAMAGCGWVRYYASGGGHKTDGGQGEGTFYEGYVPIMRNAVKPDVALKRGREAGGRFLLSPKAAQRGGILFGKRPAPWLLTTVQPQLQAKLAALRDASSQR